MEGICCLTLSEIKLISLKAWFIDNNFYQDSIIDWLNQRCASQNINIRLSLLLRDSRYIGKQLSKCTRKMAQITVKAMYAQNDKFTEKTHHIWFSVCLRLVPLRFACG